MRLNKWGLQKIDIGMQRAYKMHGSDLEIDFIDRLQCVYLIKSDKCWTSHHFDVMMGVSNHRRLELFVQAQIKENIKH